MAAAVLVAGAVIGAVGAIQQGQASSKMASMQADIANKNASEALTQAKVNEARLRTQARLQQGDIIANNAASGLQLDGSALDVLGSSAAQTEMDASLIRHGGQIQSLNFEQQANIANYQGNQAVTGSYFGAASSALTGAYKYNTMSGGGPQTVKRQSSYDDV